MYEGMSMGKKDSEKNQKKETLKNVAMSGAAYSDIQLYGDAAKQHLVAYSGVDNETGQVLKKSLKSISKEKVNPDFEFQNKQQQAGFSAEVLDVAKTNEENIIKGNPTRKVRADDIGKVNDQYVDLYEIMPSGDVVAEEQMKFYGASKNDPSGTYSSKKALDKLVSKKCEKYIEKEDLKLLLEKI